MYVNRLFFKSKKKVPMESLKLSKKIGVLCAVILVITSCQKDLQITENPETVYQQQRIGGVIPDNPEKVEKVPLIVSSEYLARAKNDASLMDALLRGKPVSQKDATTPVVSISSPSNGVTIAGTINVAVSASDNVGVKSVSLAVNGTNVSSNSTSPFTNSWNSGTVANGTYTLTVTASDAAGNKATSSIQVSVNNVTVGDIISPTINILTPTDLASVTGTVSVSMSSSDNVGVSAVSISIDNILVSTSSSYAWNTANFAAGYHTVTAIAKDAAGNQGTKTITVSINTVVVSPPPPTSSGVSLIMPPVQNQGGEASCAAFAIGHAARSVDYFYKTNATSYSNTGNVFSPEFVYNQTKAGDCGSGTGVTTALDFLKTNGVCTWQSMPYSSSNGCSLMPTSLQTSEAANYKIASYSKIITSDKTAMKSMIDNKKAVIITVAVDNSFTSALSGFIWKAYTGSPGFSHALVICGYDDSKNAYKVFNSWGTGWGDSGYSWIDYDFLPNASFYYSYVIN